MSLTADTITDDQIRKLWDDLVREPIAQRKSDGIKDCVVALGLDDESTYPQRREASARCAEILNARAAEGSK